MQRIIIEHLDAIKHIEMDIKKMHLQDSRKYYGC